MEMRAAWLAFALAIGAVPMAHGQTVNIDSFRFGVCEISSGEEHPPRFGENVGGVINLDVSTKWARENCELIIKRTIVTCQQNTIFMSNTKNRAYPGCLQLFEARSEACVAHFSSEMQKCGTDAGASDREAERQFPEEGERVEAPADPWGADAAPAAADPWKADDPWAPEAPSSALAPAGGERGAPDLTAAGEGGEEGSNYEALLKGLPGGGARPAGYLETLERLEAGQARRKAKADEARQRAAAAERDRQAERDAARERAAAEQRRQVERAARQREHGTVRGGGGACELWEALVAWRHSAPIRTGPDRVEIWSGDFKTTHIRGHGNTQREAEREAKKYYEHVRRVSLEESRGKIDIVFGGMKSHCIRRQLQRQAEPRGQ